MTEDQTASRVVARYPRLRGTELCSRFMARCVRRPRSLQPRPPVTAGGGGIPGDMKWGSILNHLSSVRPYVFRNAWCHSSRSSQLCTWKPGQHHASDVGPSGMSNSRLIPLFLFPLFISYLLWRKGAVGTEIVGRHLPADRGGAQGGNNQRRQEDAATPPPVHDGLSSGKSSCASPLSSFRTEQGPIENHTSVKVSKISSCLISHWIRHLNVGMRPGIQNAVCREYEGGRTGTREVPSASSSLCEDAGTWE